MEETEKRNLKRTKGDLNEKETNQRMERNSKQEKEQEEGAEFGKNESK
jgi:hypothetical protein